MFAIDNLWNERDLENCLMSSENCQNRTLPTEHRLMRWKINYTFIKQFLNNTCSQQSENSKFVSCPKNSVLQIFVRLYKPRKSGVPFFANDVFYKRA